MDEFEIGYIILIWILDCSIIAGILFVSFFILVLLGITLPGVIEGRGFWFFITCYLLYLFICFGFILGGTVAIIPEFYWVFKDDI